MQTFFGKEKKRLDKEEAMCYNIPVVKRMAW